MNPRLFTVTTAALLAFSSPAYAEEFSQELPDSTHTSVGGQLFADYVFPTGSFSPQAFEIKRARIYANVAYNPFWSGSIVTNVHTLSAEVDDRLTSLEAQNVYLEMGYVQATNLWPGSRIQFGDIITPWFEYEAKAWGYRMLGFLPDAGGLSPDRHGPQIVPFYDLGASLQGQYVVNDMPLSYSLAIFNGEGNHLNEADGQKDYEGRFSFTPLPDVELTGMVHKHNPSGVYTPALVNREMLLGVYQHEGYKVALEGNWDQDLSTGGAYGGDILGGWVIVPVPNPLVPTELILRGDRITGDKNSLDPAVGFRYESIVGLAFTPAKLARVVLDNQLINGQPTTGAAWNEDIIGIHTELKY